MRASTMTGARAGTGTTTGSAGAGILTGRAVVALAAATALLAPSGCGEPFTNALFEEDILYLDALPSDVLYVDTPEDSGGSVSRPAPAEAAAALPAACAAATNPCDPDMLRQFTVQVARSLNEQIYYLLSLLDKIRTFDPTLRTDNSRVWGPILVPGSDVYVRLEVTRGTATFSYEMTLSYDPNDPTDIVLAGFYRPGSTADEGVGQFSYSFTVHRDYFPDEVSMDGEMDVAYSTLGDEVDLDVTLDDMGEPGEEPFDAAYAFYAPGDGSGLFYFSQEAEIVEPDEGEPQLLEQASIWSGWKEDGWGRADIRYYGGNLGDVVAGGVECWDPGQTPVYAYLAGCVYDPSLWDATLCIEPSIGWNEETDETTR